MEIGVNVSTVHFLLKVTGGTDRKCFSILIISTYVSLELHFQPLFHFKLFSVFALLLLPCSHLIPQIFFVSLLSVLFVIFIFFNFASFPIVFSHKTSDAIIDDNSLDDAFIVIKGEDDDGSESLPVLSATSQQDSYVKLLDLAACREKLYLHKDQTVNSDYARYDISDKHCQDPASSIRYMWFDYIHFTMSTIHLSGNNPSIRCVQSPFLTQCGRKSVSMSINWLARTDTVIIIRSRCGRKNFGNLITEESIRALFLMSKHSPEFKEARRFELSHLDSTSFPDVRRGRLALYYIKRQMTYTWVFSCRIEFSSKMGG